MKIINKTSNKTIARKAWLSSPLGLMFKRISDDEACVLINEANDRIGSGIHMFFVPQELDIIWVNNEMKVVDVKHCKKWRFYWPKKGAKYVIELLDAKRTKTGDKIKFIEEQK